MKHGDMLKLRWLRMIAINDLRSDEYDLVLQLTLKYQEGETPTFTSEEVTTLGEVYDRARSHYLSDQRLGSF